MTATGKCSNATCYVQDNSSCSLGEVDHLRCMHWNANLVNDEEPTPQVINSAARVLWSGNHLGLDDLPRIASRRRPIVIGLIGASDAGKTTFLTACYLQLIKGQELSFGHFSGSYTLGAWESLASWTRFVDPMNLPTFPPHTSSGEGRLPGLLHLSLRTAKEDLVDILFTDAPGEWFSKWSIDEDAKDAEGARWIAAQADAFIVVADCERLSGGGRGQARKDTRQLLDRLSKYVKERSVSLLWTKFEEQFKVNEEIKSKIQEALNANCLNAKEFSSSIMTPECFLSILDGILESVTQLGIRNQIIEPILIQKPFEAFRG